MPLRAQEGKGRPGQVGPFEKKWLMLAIQDLEARGSAREPLGRVVVNLADFAAEDGRATQAFVVATSRTIAAAVGEAKLLVTIGCGPRLPQWEGIGGAGWKPDLAPSAKRSCW